jgi:Holliday junction resolvasome RuvABC endonuclease subunit
VTLRVVAVDPGLKPGCVELDGTTGAVLRASHKLPEWLWTTPWDIAATEAQWYHGGPANVNDLLSLAFRAGFTLACIPAARSLRIPPKVWRAACGYGPALTKEQVQKKIANNLTAQERVLFQSIPGARHGDVLDAIGIGRAALLVAPTKKWDWKL